MWQPAAAWLLVRVNIKLHFGVAVLVWSACLGLMAACSNFGGLAACRFLLGCAESAMLPICGSITGMWYTRNEQSVRVGIWYSMVGFGGIFGSLVSYGMYALRPGALARWQFIFVLLGPVTFVYGVYVLLVVPASPGRAWFLSPRERRIALERIRANKTGTTSSAIRWYQVWEALRDPRLYLAALSVFATALPNGGVTSFSAVLIEGFGFDKRTTSLVGMATGGSEVLGMWLCTWLAFRIRSRFWPALIGISVGIAGAAVMLGLPLGERVGRLIGLCFLYWFPIGMMLFIPWIQSMAAGATKRATFYCVYQLFYAAGNLSGESSRTHADDARDAEEPRPADAPQGPRCSAPRTLHCTSPHASPSCPACACTPRRWRRSMSCTGSGTGGATHAQRRPKPRPPRRTTSSSRSASRLLAQC